MILPKSWQDCGKSENEEEEEEEDNDITSDADTICDLLVDAVSDKEEITSAEDMLDNYDEVQDAFKSEVCMHYLQLC